MRRRGRRRAGCGALPDPIGCKGRASRPRRAARGGGAVQLAQGANRGGQGPTAVATAAVATAAAAAAAATAAIAAAANAADSATV